MNKIEEVARNLCMKSGKFCKDVHICDREPICKCPYWENFVDTVVTVLLAIREPTDDMGFKMLQARTHYRAYNNIQLTEHEASSIGISDHLKANPSMWCKPEFRIAIDSILNKDN